MSEDFYKLLTWLANRLPDISDEAQGRMMFWALVLMAFQVVLMGCQSYLIATGRGP